MANSCEQLATQLAVVATSLQLRVAAVRGDSPSPSLLTQHDLNVQAVASSPSSNAALDIQRSLQLTPTEAAVVWTLAASAIDPTTRLLMTELAGGPGMTLDMIKELIYGFGPQADALRELSADGTLRRLALIESTDARATERHETLQHWTLSQRVLAWMHGDTRVAPEISGAVRIAAPCTCQPAALAESRRLTEALATQDSLVVAVGAPGLGRRSTLATAAQQAGLRVLEIDAKRLGTDATLKRQLKLIARECLILGCSPLIQNVDALVDAGDHRRLDMVGAELAREISGPMFATSNVNRPAMRWGRPTIVIDVKPPTSEQRAKLWLSELGQGTQDDAEYLATQYPLAPALIHHAATAAKALANGRKMEPEDIYAAVRSVLDDKLGDYAKRVEVTQTWDDLVLPHDQMEAVQYLLARISRRRTVYEQWGFAAKVGKGLGTSALFSGPPGTGKTMVAALIAKDLGLELYQVDMAKVVSKFIGETERNLAALFDAAEAGHAILLFDEADSLFGKRTEVKSSNDRYANLETNYMLQRLESFTGICLLTSNHESNIDPAFQRRLSLHLRFELPEADERAALWRAMLPAAAPVDPNLDMTGLARRFQMSGGYIRNAALRAAFLAADEGSVITASHLERAARLEYEGMGKIAA